MSNIRKGIDVSEWQKEIDWEKVKPQIDFAIIRLGLGKSQPDAYAQRNISECSRLGIPYGLYWFSYACTVEMAKAEAEQVMALMREYGAKPALGVWFDWEYDSRNYAARQGIDVSNALLRSMAVTFCDTLAEGGHKAGIYANGDYIKHHYGQALIGTYPLWFAYLADKPGREVMLHQYSWSGRIDGIRGNVDLDIWYPDEAVRADLETVARQVIEGKWGNGAERKRRLTEAGYDPAEVQDKVNALLGLSSSANRKDLNTVAHEVISGLWGNGSQRRQMLREAGYDPDEVQAAVNKLLGVQRPQEPAKPDLTAIAKDVIRGKYGNGSARTKALKAEGFTDDQIQAIQQIVNDLSK